MKKISIFLFVVTLIVTQTFPAHAGRFKAVGSVIKGFTYKAPKVSIPIRAPRSYSIPKTTIPSSPAPARFLTKVNTAQVKIGNSIFRGKTAASINRNQARFSANTSKAFTPTYKQPPITPKVRYKNVFGKKSIKFPNKIINPAKPLAPSVLHARGIKPSTGTRLRPEYTYPIKHTNITKLGTITPNIKIDQRKKIFEDKLKSRRYIQSPTKITNPVGLKNFKKGNVKYTTRLSANSTKTPTADRYLKLKDGKKHKLTQKLRLN